MNQMDHNINKNMSDFDLIDVESLDFADDQTWLYKVPEDSGVKLDIVDWCLSLEWPNYDDEDYKKTDKELYSKLDEILNYQVLAMPDRHKFDSRTYVKPKKRVQRPSINNIVEGSSNSSSLNNSLNTFNSSGNKFLTYNKYSSPFAPILRLKTFSVDANTENSNAIKEYASKRKSLVSDDDPQLEDVDVTLVSDVSERQSTEPQPTKPINIDLSQPAHNIHNTFNKGILMGDRPSLNMYQSGESLMRMSPPSLVSSLLMETSGNFNQELFESRKHHTQKDPVSQSGRESIEQMMTSMTLSILDEKDMSTSFLSQTTYPDNESLMDSLPPSLVSSVNSSYVVPTTPKHKTDSMDSNIFSSATFTHLEQSEKLLSARPRHQMYNSFTRRETPMKNSESYTKAREEGVQFDSHKILNENNDKKEGPKVTKPDEMSETITLHYSNNKFKKSNDAEKENLDASFEKDDQFFKDMGLQRTVDLGRNSLNVTLDKQELNEIIQARQKLSLARKALPNEAERLPNQVEVPQTIKAPHTFQSSQPFQMPTQVVSVPKKSMENASELLARRRVYANGFEKQEETVREPPKRNATFKKGSPRGSMDTTVVYVKDDAKIIDINSATLNLIDGSDRSLQQEDWGSQERAMVGSSESTDTATFSSSSPPESVPDTTDTNDSRAQVASTPLAARKNMRQTDLLNLHTTISPIYNMVDDKSYTVTSLYSNDVNNTTVINTATLVKKTAKRDILSGKVSPDKKFAPATQAKSPPGKVPKPSASYSVMAPPPALPRKTGLPTSKLRQYSSHKELRIPPNGQASGSGIGSRGTLSGFIGGSGPPRTNMMRRNVYASNPALSPTAPAPARRDSYIISSELQSQKEEEPKNVLINPPVLVRQGTETLTRPRPQSQLMQPKDHRSVAPSISVPNPIRNVYVPPPSSRGPPQSHTINRPTSVPSSRARTAVAVEQRPMSSMEPRVSALPRPSRLPGPRRTLRPPSVYSVAPASDINHY